MHTYTQPAKNKARSIAIKSAIKILTSQRNSSTLVRRSYVRDVRDHICNSDNVYDIYEAGKLSDDSINRWENFYDSILQKKKASQLKVAYLSGPNPENDLEIFCSLGILPENIWAFESDGNTYSEAVSSALTSEYPFIKIMNVKIESFLEISQQKFDIIYLDFCGPLPNKDKKQKTLYSITKILSKHSLNSPGVLITNVALPTKEQDESTRRLLAKLVTCYLYPKDFVEHGNNGFIEGPIAHSIYPDQWLKKVESKLDNYYGQFITRLLIDHSTFISPCDRAPYSNQIFNKLFNIYSPNKNEELENEIIKLFHFDDNYGGGDIISDTGSYSILWTLASLSKKFNGEDSNYADFIYKDPEFESYSERFISQLNFNNDHNALIKNISTMIYLLSNATNKILTTEQKERFNQIHEQLNFHNSETEDHDFLSKKARELCNKHSLHDFYNFCDLVLFHQIMELFVRQITTPYHVNIEKTKRWTYQAKDTPMYMDMIVLDECRYIYDWMPTIDMFADGINDIERQLTYRFALDGVQKHSRWYNSEYFSGTAVIDQFTPTFEAKILKPRKKIK